VVFQSESLLLILCCAMNSSIAAMATSSPWVFFGVSVWLDSALGGVAGLAASSVLDAGHAMRARAKHAVRLESELWYQDRIMTILHV